MPICPECGIDVAETGLCPECRIIKKKERSINKPRLSLKPERIIIIILLMIIAGEAGFILGRELNRDNASLKNPERVSSAYLPDIGNTPEPANNPAPPPKENTSSTQGSDRSLTSAYDLQERKFELPLDDKETFVRWILEHRPEEEYYVDWRWDCAQDLLEWESIKEERILTAFLLAPREKFIRDRNKNLAYDHRYLPIGYGATITDPWVVSIMTQILNPDFDHRVLEIGTGSGYQAAILAELSNHVYSIEIIEELLDETDQIYNRMEKDYPEYANIIRKADDGYYGWEEYAPFERIIVTCGIDHIPPDLLKQLTPGGIMVIPVGPPSGQTLMKVEKKVDINGNIFFDREKIMSVKFIPFVTKEGRTR